MKYSSIEKEFINAVIQVFDSKRIICILFYGTNAFREAPNHTSDYDFYVMLDSYNDGDDTRLRSIMDSFVSITLDLTYQYLDDVDTRGWSNYQLGNHGIFYILNFAQSKVLYGYNIFQRKLGLLDTSLIQDSILRQIQEYFWRLDNWFLKQSGQDNILLYKKYLTRIIIDILLLHGDISFQEINEKTDKKVAEYIKEKAYFSDLTKLRFMELIGIENGAQDLSQLRDLQRSLYNDYLCLYKYEY